MNWLQRISLVWLVMSLPTGRWISCAAGDGIVLTDVAVASGLDCIQNSGADGDHIYPEIVFGGACLADFDQDGDLDAYVPQGGSLKGPEGRPESDLLYLNDGDGNFNRAEGDRGIPTGEYCMGAFAADVDSDGDLDLLLTNVGRVRLLRNRGNATFEDMTDQANIPDRFGVWLNAIIGDLNGDGFVDIYVANYVNWKVDQDIPCKASSGQRDYCNPKNYDGATDMLLFGSSQGVFRDVTNSSGIGTAQTRSMGVVAFDVESDGDLDLFVANDGEANLLWVQQEDGRFVDEALIRGVALNGAGQPEASMGVACADIDADGDDDLVVSHLVLETNTVYQNDDGYFSDVTAPKGVSGWSRPDTGFGIGLVDFDNDGLSDLFVANGAVARPIQTDRDGKIYAQPDRVAKGVVGGRFPSAVVVPNGRSLNGRSLNGRNANEAVSRGAAFGDTNGDGRVDVLVSVKDDVVRLLRNETPSGAWLAIRPVAAEGLTAEIGSRVRVMGTEGLSGQTVRPHGSYLGSSEHLVRFGLGSRDNPVDVVVSWVDGSRELFSDLALRQQHMLVKGRGAAWSDDGVQRTAAKSTQSAIPTKDVNSSADHSEQPAVVRVPTGDLEPIPPLKLVTVSPRKKKVEFDAAALSDWCQRANLPKPPEKDALDPITWKLVHQAYAKAGADPSAKNLGKLAMFLDGHAALGPALDLYKRLVVIEPKQATWWHLLGRAASKSGENDVALKAFKEAVALRPNSAASRARLAQAELDSGNAAESIRAWNQYVEQRPADPFGHTGLAHAYEASGALQLALLTANKALESPQPNRAATILRARISARMGERDEAEKWKNLADGLSASDDPVLTDEVDNFMYQFSKSIPYLRKAAAYQKQMGNYEQAYETALLLAERRPDDPNNWQLLVWLATVSGKKTEALEMAKVAVELDPAFAPGWDTLARERIEKNDVAAALEMVNKAVAADPSFAKARGTRGLLLGKLKRYEESLADLAIAIKSHPNNQLLWKMRAANLVNLGRKGEAIQVLDEMRAKFPGDKWAGQLKSELLANP